MELPAERPVVLAPMAGGVGTPELAAAVAEAGGLGSVPAGYLTADGLRAALDAYAALTDRPVHVNLFVPGPAGPPRDVAAYAERLRPLAERHGVALGEPRRDDDALAAKVALLEERPVAVVSTTFGLLDAGQRDRLRATGATLVATVTSAEEARRAADAGVDALCVQGAEAGGHRGLLEDDPAHPAGGPLVGLLALLAQVSAATDLPLVAAGGIVDAEGARAAREAGAIAVQAGTAFLRCPEAGTSAVQRAVLADGRYAGTVVTRAFTGRPARGLANALALEPDPPAAYPEVHHLTRPLRAAATRAGDADVPNLWAGTGWRAAREEPAAAVVARLAR